VLAQTYTQLEVVAVDDGSEDRTAEVLRQAAARDDRVRVLVNDRNVGIIRTLNRAVAESKGEFIARMDADDIVVPDRIERQVAVLRTRPEVGVVGSAVVVTDENGRAVGTVPVRCTHPSAAPFLALFAVPVMHATLMARSEVMRAFPYRDAPECLHAEDYDLFTRMLAAGVQMVNTTVALYKKRTHAAGISNQFEPIQVANFVGLASRQLERTLHVRVRDRVHRVLVNRMDSRTSRGDLQQGLRLLDRMRDLFLQGIPPDDAELRSEVIAIADQQRIDILGLAIRKGSPAQRIAGLALLGRYARAFRSRQTRQYLRGKFARRVSGPG
jgi:glycosyltransferase involved in cell wall biosynthesis